MRKLVLRMSITLDSFVCGPNGEMDWFLKTRGADGAAWLAEKMGQAGAHLLGRKVFAGMATFWPNSTDVIAKPMNEIPKIVFSKVGFDPAMKEPIAPNAKSWSEARVMTGDLAENIKLLKQEEGKDLLANGGASFAQSLVQTGLIDEYWLLRHPSAIGKGEGLFTQLEVPLHLKLIETKTFSAGTTAQIFRPE